MKRALALAMFAVLLLMAPTAIAPEVGPGDDACNRSIQVDCTASTGAYCPAYLFPKTPVSWGYRGVLGGCLWVAYCFDLIGCLPL